MHNSHPAILRHLNLAATAAILAFWCFSIKAQVLFDNTKAETAGNADWIIDIHQPIPSQSITTITASTSETNWTGAPNQPQAQLPSTNRPQETRSSGDSESIDRARTAMREKMLEIQPPSATPRQDAMASFFSPMEMSPVRPVLAPVPQPAPVVAPLPERLAPAGADSSGLTDFISAIRREMAAAPPSAEPIPSLRLAVTAPGVKPANVRNASSAESANEAAADANPVNGLTKASAKGGKLAPILGPPLPISLYQRWQLHLLLLKYDADQITPEEYHLQRAKILSEQ